MVFAMALVLTGLFYYGERLGIKRADTTPEYVEKIFDDSYVHRIDLQIENWNEFLENADEEEYHSCDISIDGEKFEQVGLRVKGNNSKSLVKQKYALFKCCYRAYPNEMRICGVFV